MPPTDAEIEARFWKHVSPEPNSGCWLWTASEDGRGYGQFAPFGWRGLHKQGSIKAYKFAYLFYRGSVPDGKELDHVCRNRLCVNPDHLEPVSHRENVLRGDSPSARQARQTHCKRGHEFTAENTWSGDEHRRCKTCDKVRMAAFHKARREASHSAPLSL